MQQDPCLASGKLSIGRSFPLRKSLRDRFLQERGVDILRFLPYQPLQTCSCVSTAQALDSLTTVDDLGSVDRMKARCLLRRRVVVATDAFVEMVIWEVPGRVSPSTQYYKYRLAYVVRGECVLRYDNERGKGDHRHSKATDEPYKFTSAAQLMADFEADVARWNHEHGNS